MTCPSTPRPIFLIILMVVASVACSAQDDTTGEDELLADSPSPLTVEESSVAKAVTALFDAMRVADSAAVRAAFLPNATLQSVSLKEGSETEYVLSETPVDAFVEAMAGDHPPYDERVSNWRFRIDGGLATAWMDYEFYLGDRYSHCGVNAFQFMRTEDGWKILHVTDTRRATCE